MSELQDRLRALPQVGALLEDERLAPLVAGRRSLWMTPVIQEVIAVFRRELQHDKGLPASREELHEAVVARVMSRREQLLGPSWTRVINGTGVVVHTNLGRSNFPEAAARAAHQVALHNSDLEYDLPAGVRGHRGRRVEEKAALLAGARDALIVNNNAAAVWLAVRFLSQGGPVIISRGEIVAIGGSFRIHEILSETGCQLVEVGTTNRTSLDDYRKAMVPGATVLKVHRSNFTVEGFTEEVDLPELAQLCRQQSCPLIYDAGSGALYPYTLLGLPDDERLLAEDVAAGADLVTCSGDKLLGGCQAGMILGSKEHVAGLRKHPHAPGFPGGQDHPGRAGRRVQPVSGRRGCARGAHLAATGGRPAHPAGPRRTAAGHDEQQGAGGLERRRGVGPVQRGGGARSRPLAWNPGW